MTDFKKIPFRDGVPLHIKAHIKTLFEGIYRKRGSTIFHEYDPYLTDNDKENIENIIKNTHISVWEKLEKIIPDTAEQIKFFDAAWVAAIDYNQFRYRRGQAGETLKEELSDKREKIQTTVQELRQIITQHNQLLGGAAFRAHIGTPELDEALKGLLWEIQVYDEKQIHAESFVCAAIKSREKSPRREYLRAFLAILAKNAFPFEKKGVESLILSFAAQSYGKDITRYDVKDILKEMKMG